MALALSDVRLIVQRVCTHPEVLAACRRHDLGFVVETLGKNEPKVTQGQIAALTGISQGRLSEYMNHKRTPEKAQLFLDFADGLCMPAVARQALGLGPSQSATAGAVRWDYQREHGFDSGYFSAYGLMNSACHEEFPETPGKTAPWSEGE